jgi:hypothetical protein
MLETLREHISGLLTALCAGWNKQTWLYLPSIRATSQEMLMETALLVCKMKDEGFSLQIYALLLPKYKRAAVLINHNICLQKLVQMAFCLYVTGVTCVQGLELVHSYIFASSVFIRCLSFT